MFKTSFYFLQPKLHINERGAKVNTVHVDGQKMIFNAYKENQRCSNILHLCLYIFFKQILIIVVAKCYIIPIILSGKEELSS